MADRYWVGGSGSWNSTTKWSASSGGASGASVPTASDNAIFNASSGAAHYVVTVTDNATCANLTFTPVAADGVTQFAVGNGFVIAGAFSTSGTQGNRRALFRSSTYGLLRDISIASFGTITDVDFRDIRITGAAGTLTGTRIGDLGGCLNITFSTTKTVYWVTAAGGNWSGNNWASGSGGGASTDNFPLAQDTATIENTGLNTSATVTMDNVITYTGTVTMSTRTNAMTLSLGTGYSIYGNWINGSGTTLSGVQTLTFSGRSTQTITSSGKTFSGGITIDSYGGAVELADALDVGTRAISVNNGNLDTKNFNVTAASISSSNSAVRKIILGSSTLTLSTGILLSQFNLTFDAGTSQINVSGATFDGGGAVFYNVSFTSTTTTTVNLTGSNTFTNLTCTAPASAGLTPISISGNNTISGTFTASGASPVRRVFIRSNSFGTARTLTVGTLAAIDTDFRDITIAGGALNSSPTRAGNCGGNSGITFPSPKTVYWNLAGAQNWSATAWCPTSGGTPDINQFPLAQDTAVFNEAAGSVTGTITINGAWNIGTFDASLRTSAMTLTTDVNTPAIYGNWKFGTGVTSSSTTGTINFLGRSTSTITSNGITFGCALTVSCITGTVNLADALSLNSARQLTLTSGTFDAVTYNVTSGLFQNNGSASVLKMGSGTWTLSGTGTVWNISSSPIGFYKSTANITLSDTSTTARTFAGNGLSYNKLTIGGTTGISTLTVTGDNSFTELASTKTVAHTIALGTTTQTFGKWSVTGTSGNVVTLTGTGTSHALVGACTSGIDYLAIGSIRFAATSPGEFYAGVNSTATGTPAAPTYLTAKPADSARYWVGGTGNWSDTNRWSTGSGAGGGAAVPRSHDDVVFDAASNATAYTATVDAVTGGARCKTLTIAGPGTGNVTLAGTASLYIHDNITLPAAGLTRTYTGLIVLTGSTSGRTITANGVALSSYISVNGVNCEWTLGSALDVGSQTIAIINGTLDLATYNLTCGNITSTSTSSRTIKFGSSTVSMSTAGLTFGSSERARASLTVDAGTSQINMSSSSPLLSGNNQTFYNVSFTSASTGLTGIEGINTFNNLSITGSTVIGLKLISLAGDQTITNTLTISAGTDATRRCFVYSDTVGVTRTLTCGSVTMTDVDFRDITIAGGASPASGTRIGDCKGNSGITFTGASTRYWNFAGGGNWSDAGWAASSGASPNVNNFPLAQDTCIFESTGLNSGATITIDASYNIGTIDMSARTSNTMTLATGTINPVIHGNWINGTGTTISGTETISFRGRGTQTITSAGKTFTQFITIDTIGGSVTLQDSFGSNKNATYALWVSAGTFDAATYDVTLSGSFVIDGANEKTVAVGSGTWRLSRSGTAWNVVTSNVTITGTGTIQLSSSSAKTFAGGGLSYAGITISQAGSGTLTITGDNTFKDITNGYSATGSTTISLGTTTQTISQFTATGTSGKVLTLTGTSSTSPCTLIKSTSGDVTGINYLIITGVRSYPL